MSRCVCAVGRGLGRRGLYIGVDMVGVSRGNGEEIMKYAARIQMRLSRDEVKQRMRKFYKTTTLSSEGIRKITR